MVVCEDQLAPLLQDEDISKTWLQKLLSLRLGCKVVVKEWTCRRPKGREGFLSEIAFVKVTFVEEKVKEIQLDLVFKFLPKDPELQQFLANGGLVKREIGFYKFLECGEFQDICRGSGIDVPVPEVLYAGLTGEAMTLVMRDLGVDGYRSLVVKEGSTYEQTATAIRATAVVHGLAMAYLLHHSDGTPATSDATRSPLSALTQNFSTEFYEQFFQPNLETLAAMFEGSELAGIMVALKPHTQAIFNDSDASTPDTFPSTVIHGDLWAGQLLYSADEKKVSILDWQFSRVDSPMTDIVSMLFMSSHPDLLTRTDELLQCYWDALTTTLQATATPLSATFQDLEKSLERHWMMGFQFLAVSLHDFQGAGNITDERVKGAIQFLHQRGVFIKFLQDVGAKGF